MNLITLPSCRILIVDNVPEGARFIQGVEFVVYKNKRCKYRQRLPPGNWQEPLLVKDCTEDQAKGIVEFRFGNQSEMLEPGYINYNPSRNGWGEKYIQNFDTALKSFHSLMKSHQAKETDLILIEKI